MTDFENEWNRIIQNSKTFGEILSPALKKLVADVYIATTAQPVHIQRVKDALESLLEFLTIQEGRTDNNCWATNAFFLLAEGWDWDSLPEELKKIMSDVAMALHDTVSNPEIARNFESTPEQLLERLRNIKPKTSSNLVK